MACFRRPCNIIKMEIAGKYKKGHPELHITNFASDEMKTFDMGPECIVHLSCSGCKGRQTLDYQSCKAIAIIVNHTIATPICLQGSVRPNAVDKCNNSEAEVRAISSQILHLLGKMHWRHTDMKAERDRCSVILGAKCHRNTEGHRKV